MGEGEWLISNRNKILRKQACCQSELTLPYCLAVGVRVSSTPVCMCVNVRACVNRFLLVNPMNQCSFIHMLCVFSELIEKEGSDSNTALPFQPDVRQVT